VPDLADEGGFRSTIYLLAAKISGTADASCLRQRYANARRFAALALHQANPPLRVILTVYYIIYICQFTRKNIRKWVDLWQLYYSSIGGILN
jgi:hypothetical protein